ncbi:MAG TPA: hypothetical protein VGD78_12575 [Chthoniobacterales bacterium]
MVLDPCQQVTNAKVRGTDSPSRKIFPLRRGATRWVSLISPRKKHVAWHHAETPA